MSTDKAVSAAVVVSDRAAIKDIVSNAITAGDHSAQIAIRGNADAIVSVLLGLGDKAGDVSAVLALRKT